jgi:hypothetical protein
MQQTKKQQLQTKGWQVGSTRDFLQLTRKEFLYIKWRECVTHLLNIIKWCIKFVRKKQS